MLHLKHVFGGALDMFGDLVAVGRAEEQGAEDQHVQGALEKLDFLRTGFVTHGRLSTFIKAW